LGFVVIDIMKSTPFQMIMEFNKIFWLYQLANKPSYDLGKEQLNMKEQQQIRQQI